jgi:hypothetical protein
VDLRQGTQAGAASPNDSLDGSPRPPGGTFQWTGEAAAEAWPSPQQTPPAASRLPRLLASVAVGLAAFLLLAGAGLALDLDRDGDSGYSELADRTNPFDGDTDSDGLADGWERRHGLAALAADSDGDGLEDGAEVRAGADPGSPDSDGDGLLDSQEPEGKDCDGDGVGAVREGDDDADGRLDGLETALDPCDPDVDDDSVLDGSEGNAVCIHIADCDGDGLGDGQEQGAFDPLDPDSFDSGVPDSVSQAFQDSGQPTGSDDDLDGIPDGWEASDGLIEWGRLQPVAGERDLLVEFVRVETPGSGRTPYSGLDYADAYDLVAEDFLEEAGIHLRWTETVVEVEEERNPPLIPTIESDYYRDVLGQARHSENPYVTSVVLNPKHNQSEVPHLGVAPIRGMLAAVVYGGHVTAEFEADNGATMQLPVIIESYIQDEAWEGVWFGPRNDPGSVFFNDLYEDEATGDIVLRSDSRGWTLSWEPSWFGSAPVLEDDSGATLPFQQTGATLEERELAFTIMHEIGHTLGLCHTHVPECAQAYTFRDQLDQFESTMSYDSDPTTLHYLPSEWEVASDYLTCPPQAPLALVAQDAPAREIRESKYTYSMRSLDDIQLRECQFLEAMSHEFSPNEPEPATYVQPRSYASAPAGGGLLLPLAALILILAGGAAAGLWVWRRP